MREEVPQARFQESREEFYEFIFLPKLRMNWDIKVFFLQPNNASVFFLMKVDKLVLKKLQKAHAYLDLHKLVETFECPKDSKNVTA